MTRSSSVRRALPACLTGKSDAITGVRRWAPLAATLALGLLAAACEPGASSATARASGAGGAGGASTACKPGEFRCTGDVLEHCSEDGKAFAKVVTCPVPGLCDAVGGQCDVCSSTAATCQDATTLDRCSADGQKNTPVACTGKTPYCAPTKAGDSCVECTKATDCVSSASECELAVCSADGVCAAQAVTAGTACGPVGQSGACDAKGACTYCAQGQGKCEGLAPSICDAKGQWKAGAPCNGAAPICLSGGCVACEAAGDCPSSANECQAPSCSAKNSCGFTPKALGTPCADGAGTCDGAGQCNSCPPGSKVCNGDQLLFCSAQGKYDAPISCSGATPKCDPQNPKCVACYDASQCPAGANACLVATCKGNACGFENAANGAACGGGTCSGGACVCSAGQANCDLQAANGCEVNLSTDSANCGGCGVVCGAGSACVSGLCSVGGLSCLGGLSCAGGVSCCDAQVVPGGTFPMGRGAGTDACPGGMACDPNEQPEHNVTVASFKLDTFEVTVGRFRKFVTQVNGTPPAVGAGAHPLIANSGWQAGWNASLAASQAALVTKLKCDAQYQTWTDAPGANEGYAINCVSWFEAAAFCAWDSGRTPTEAEWEYASAGGSDNRLYAWGAADPSVTKALANDSYSNKSPFIAVGSHPSGNGKWGHRDLAGGMWEWNLDWYDDVSWYKNGTCNDCANLAVNPYSYRVVRGAAWGGIALLMRSATRSYGTPTSRGSHIGLRCARSAP